MLAAMQRQSSAVARWWLRAIALALVSAALALGGASSAQAAPRLVLVEGAELAQLHEALRISLQPWSFEVVDWPRPAPSGEPVDGAALARKANARYVVWYDADGGQLVVYDAELARGERRALAELPRDEVDASALALSIKTMLRLQPPSGDGPVAPVAPVATPAPKEERWRWLPSLRLGPRFGLDGDGATQLRAQLGVAVAPPGLRGVRFGLLGGIGTATDVDVGGFKGDWSEWSVRAAVGKDVALTAWTLRASAAVGLSRASIAGEEMKVSRSETQSHVCGTAIVGLMRALGPLTAGVEVELEARGAGNFTRANGQPLWEEPSLLLGILGVVELAL
jgi:hypothetical protein